MSNLPDLKRDAVEKLVKKYEERNGNKLADFSIKEIVLMFHKNTQEEIRKCNKKMDTLNKKISAHEVWGQKESKNIYKIISDHDKIMQHIIDVLPEKGFCEKITHELELGKELTMANKVEILWNDRRWIKNLLYITMALVSALGGGNLIVSLFG